MIEELLPNAILDTPSGMGEPGPQPGLIRKLTGLKELGSAPPIHLPRLNPRVIEPIPATTACGSLLSRYNTSRVTMSMV
jgi:hypothetical protein